MILLASGDPVVRSRWAEILENSGVAEVDHARRLTLFLGSRAPVLILLHLSLPGLDGVGGVAELKKAYPDLPVMVFADVPAEEEGLAVLRNRADGYANTYMTPAMLRKAAEVVQMGELWVGRRLMQRLLGRGPVGNDEPSPLEQLTDREREVALLVAGGGSNRQVAASLGVTERTVKAHLTAIFKKTGIQDRMQLAVRLNQRQGLTESQSA